ncbi:6257_t:CDS:1, partial [Racocetra persica]
TILQQSGSTSFNEILTFNNDEAVRTEEVITRNQNHKIWNLRFDRVLNDDISRDT